MALEQAPDLAPADFGCVELLFNKDHVPFEIRPELGTFEIAVELDDQGPCRKVVQQLADAAKRGARLSRQISPR